MNRWFLSVLFNLILTTNVFSESIAELSLMHQRNPRNKTVLYYLASGYLKDYEFNKAYHFFTKLRMLDPNFQNLNAGIAHSLYGLGKLYDSYQICRINERNLGCEKFLNIFGDKHAQQMSLYRFLYKLRVEKFLDIKQAEFLLKEMPRNIELIETLGDYFLKQDLSEIAFDLMRLAPTVYSQRAIYFRRMVRDLRRQFREIKFEGRDQEKLHYLAYYIWKFAPEFGEEISSPNISKLMDFYKSKLSQRTHKQFENYYRLAYLQALEGLKKDAEISLEKALAVAPNGIFSLILEKTVKRQLKVRKAVEIVTEDLSKVDASKESYSRWRRSVNDPNFRTSKTNAKSSGLMTINKANGFFLPRNKSEYKNLISSADDLILLEFCNPSRENCKRVMKDVYTKPKLKKILTNFQKIRVNPDTELGRYLRKQFPLRIQPQIYCLNSNLDIQGEFFGLADVQGLEVKLQKLVR